MKTKTHYQIQTYCTWHREWEPIDNKERTKKQCIKEIWDRRNSKDLYYKTTRCRLVEVTERVIPVGNDKA